MTKRNSLRVLVAATDVYSATGGGETFFKGLFRHNSNSRYTYFESEYAAPATKLPPNVEAVKLERRYRDKNLLAEFAALNAIVPHLDFSREGDRIADIIDMAASVRGRHFDIIEMPDYLVHGWLLLPLLRHFGVTWKKSVLSMHGTISDALRDNWQGDGVGDVSVLEQTESLLYRSCDVRYGIARPYVEAWSTTENLPAKILDPRHIIDVAGLSKRVKSAEADDGDRRRPDLAFVGRQDKWKGPDLFLEICSLIPKQLYNYVHFYGSPAVVYDHVSTKELARLGEHRGIRYQSNRPVPRALLLDSFTNQRMVTILPSRRDTFNLTAIESLLSGCPTAVSSRCGAVDYLDKALPDLPYVKFNIQDLYAAAGDIGDLLNTYDEQRKILRDKLSRLKFLPYGDAVSDIYETPSAADPEAVALAQRAGAVVIEQLAPGELQQFHMVRAELNRHFGDLVAETGYKMGAEGFDTALSMSWRLSRIGRGLGLTSGADGAPGQADPSRLLTQSERVVAELQPHSGAADRVKTYGLLAELEGLRGNPAIKAAYLARCMRLNGYGESEEIDELARLLESVGLPEEATVARLTFGKQDEALYDYLKARQVSNSLTPESGIVERKDYRRRETPRVSVIVSVYNGALKMARFVEMLERQTETSRDRMEVIFVDSASTDDTRGVLNALLSRKGNDRKLSALYVRSEKRETIQKAWNRGIAEARGDVVTFLGNDEAMRPDTLDIFLDVLDQNPAIDWVQGNAIVTEVDTEGAYVRDIFPHRRSFDSQNVHYLECCYIGFAGAAYRRELHSRFGLYDPAFRSAGDNEFKNRLLPYINVHTVDETLGLFLNYPEVRTTESPIAELEDIRAWYAFRTPAGVRRAFENQTDAHCIDQFYRALNYSRSYSTQISTDLEYATTIAAYIEKYRPLAYRRIADVVPGAQMILDGYKIVDRLDTEWVNPSSSELEDDLNNIKRAARLVAEGSQVLARRGHDIPFWYRNDNRSQQHYFPWPSFQRRFVAAPALGAADLAGAQDLAELVSGSLPEFGFADFTRAWRHNDLHQLMRLYGEPRFDVFMPVFPQEGLEALVADVASSLPGQNDRRLSMLVAGPIASELISRLPPNIYLTGAVENERPLLAASRSVAVPGFEMQTGRRYLQHVFDAAWHGRPLVIGVGVAEAIAAILPGFAVEAFEVADGPDDMARRIFAIHQDAGRREAALGAGDAFLAALEAGGMLASKDRPASDIALWNDDVRWSNNLLHACFETTSDGRGHLFALEHRLKEPGFRAMFEAMLDSLLISKDAAMLRTKQGIFTAMTALKPAPSLMAAYARLYLWGYSLTLPAARRLAEHVDFHARHDLTNTPLGIWRRGGAPLASPTAVAEGENVVLMGVRDFWGSAEGKALKPAIAKLREQLGDRLVLAGGAGGQLSGHTVHLLESIEIETRLKNARVVALLGTAAEEEQEGARADGVLMWAQALASPAVVVGTPQALWFAEGMTSPAILPGPAQVMERIAAVASGKGRGWVDLAAEKTRLLDRLGVRWDQ